MIYNRWILHIYDHLCSFTEVYEDQFIYASKTRWYHGQSMSNPPVPRWFIISSPINPKVIGVPPTQPVTRWTSPSRNSSDSVDSQSCSLARHRTPRLRWDLWRNFCGISRMSQDEYIMSWVNSPNSPINLLIQVVLWEQRSSGEWRERFGAFQRATNGVSQPSNRVPAIFFIDVERC